MARGDRFDRLRFAMRESAYDGRGSMAESVKRRVAAARLAVAFVAAGTIAGATAWAQADPPPLVAQSSARGQHIKKATLQLRSEDIVDGSLLFKDFKKFEVVSAKHFQKVELDWRSYKKATLSDISTIKGELGDIKSQLGSYIKGESKDFLKVTDDVVRGDGSVFTASKLVPSGQLVRLLDVPGQFTVDATGPTIRITNTDNSPLTYSYCTHGAGGAFSGTLQPNESTDCDDSDRAFTLQLVGTGPGGVPQVSTLNFSSMQVPGGMQSTVQILIGL
jgi:hypothetical protein